MSRALPFVLVLVFGLATSAISQSTTYVTSPKGFLSTEGNTHFYLTSGTAVNRRYMAIDNTLLNTVASFKSFALRRDSSSTTLTNVGSTQFTVSLNMGIGNFARMHSTCDDNYVGPKTNVFSRKVVNFPDWRTRGNAPAAFDFVLTLSQPFVYIGQNAFIWDLSFEGPTAGHRLTDRVYETRASVGSIQLGSGCVATGHSYGFMHRQGLQNSGAGMGKFGMRIISYGVRAPANANVLMSIAVKDANATIPGWCGKLRALPLAMLPLGNATSSGRIDNQYWSFPYAANLVGQQFVTQLIAPDAGSPGGFVMSNGSLATIPTTSSQASIHAAYMWADLFNTPVRGSVWIGGSYIARLGY